MSDYDNLANTNIRRINEALYQVHKAMSQLDISNFNRFMKTETGQKMAELANIYANNNPGLKYHYKNMYDMD